MRDLVWNNPDTTDIIQVTGGFALGVLATFFFLWLWHKW